MASSATTVSSFELVGEQQLTEEGVAMATQEAQEERTREAAVAAGLVLEEPSVAPTCTAADVMQGLTDALEKLKVALDGPDLLCRWKWKLHPRRSSKALWQPLRQARPTRPRPSPCGRWKTSRATTSSRTSMPSRSGHRGHPAERRL